MKRPSIADELPEGTPPIPIPETQAEASWLCTMLDAGLLPTHMGISALELPDQKRDRTGPLLGSEDRSTQE